jgi:putative transposase
VQGARGVPLWIQRLGDERAVAAFGQGRGSAGAHQGYSQPKPQDLWRTAHPHFPRPQGRSLREKRVARLMATEGLQGAHRRRKWRTTIADRTIAPAPDLVDRNFVADAPDCLWVADIKYIPTWSGHMHLAVVLDVFSRRAVGWSLRDHLRTELVTEALEMAVYRRRPSDGLVHHSDQGSQYTSLAFGHRLEESGIAPSMGSVGDAYDNALAESFFATLETELLWTILLRTKSDARIAIFDFIEGFYNTHRMHSSIDMWSPAEYERRYYEKISSADSKTFH